MPLELIRADITKLKADAIVNAANKTLLGGGGVDGAIHKAAGIGLLQECMKLCGCKTGQAKVTGGYRLPAKYVIHTVGPVWKGGDHGEQALLESCYRESLRLAAELDCQSVAFPLISSGVYGYPKDQALRVAADTISRFLQEHDMLVYLVLFDKNAFQISQQLFSDITAYIDDRYVDENLICRRASRMPSEFPAVMAECSEAIPEPHAPRASKFQSLEQEMERIDESFTQMLLRKIDEAGMTDSQCYKKANVDRKLFSKIRSDIHYRPKKTTAIAFAIALELSLAETKDMLMKAGYALSHSNKFDIIIEYFITRGNYNIFEINEALFAFDQSLLGV